MIMGLKNRPNPKKAYASQNKFIKIKPGILPSQSTQPYSQFNENSVDNNHLRAF